MNDDEVNPQEISVMEYLVALGDAIQNLHAVLFKKGIISADDFVGQTNEDLQDSWLIEITRGTLVQEQQEREDERDSSDDE